MINFFQLGILGMTGTGKSYLTTQLIKHLVKHSDRIIVVDDLKQINIPFQICFNLYEFIQAVIDRHEFKLILRFDDFNDYELAFAIIWLLNNSLLIIDELSLYCDPFSISESLRNISQRGRLKNISLIWNTQRPANISRNISSQNEFIISFRLQEIADLKFFYFDKSKSLQVQQLENRQYTLLRGDPHELKKRLKNYTFRLTIS